MDDLIFEQTRLGIVLKQSGSNAAFQTVPETWQGQPVIGIGKYAFANQTQLRRVTLPKHINSIDNHAFYNCSNLEQLTLLKGVDSVGNGVLTNCRSLHQISVHGLSHIRGIVTDFLNEYVLTVTTEQGDTIRLLFPAYDYAFEEAPCRGFRSISYGSGSFYRTCVLRKEIDFAEYDRCFRRAIREDEPHTVQEIAFYRLLYPYQLRETAKQAYLDYLRDHAAEAVTAVLEQRDVPRLELLLGQEILSRDVLEDAIAQASGMDFPEGVSLLMDHRLSRFGRPRKRFSL